MTSGNPTQQIALPAQGCDTVTVSGYFAYPGSCMDNINTAMIVTSANDTITADTCVTVVEPCLQNADLIIPDSAFSQPYGQLLSNISIYLQGRFYINDNLTLQNCSVSVAPGGQIIVMQDLLELDNTVIEGCGFMWKSIHLVTVTANILVWNGSRISDADTAIVAENKTSFRVYDSEITECVRGIYTEPNTSGNYSFFNNAKVYGTKFGMWHSNTFKPGYVNQPPHGSKPFAGIHFNNMAGTVIGDYSQNKNKFKDMNAGIVAEASFIKVLHSEFKHIQPVAFYNQPYNGTAVTSVRQPLQTKSDLAFFPVGGGGLTIDSCHRGVYSVYSTGKVADVRMDHTNTGVFSTKTTQSGKFEVMNCEITAKDFGIHWLDNHGAKEMKAESNYIYITYIKGEGISLGEMITGNNVKYTINGNYVTLYGGRYGIHSLNVNNPQITYNIVDQQMGTAGNTPQSEGIAAEGSAKALISCNSVMIDYGGIANNCNGIRISQSPDAVVQCNTTERHEYGIYFGGITPSVFRGNTMYDHFAGLYLNNVAVIDTQTHAGNRWPGTYSSSYGAVNMNDSILQNLEASLFIIDPNLGSDYTPAIPVDTIDPPFFVNNTGWFDPGTGTTFSCTGQYACNAFIIGEGGSEDLKRLIARDSTLTAEYIPESKTIAKQYLFSLLKSDNTLFAGDAEFEQFVNDYKQENIGYLFEAGKYITTATDNSDSIKIMMTLIDSLMEVYADSLFNASVSNAALHQMLNDSLSSLSEQQNNLLLQAMQSKDSLLNEAGGKNGLVQAGDEPEMNEKLLNEINILYYKEGKEAIVSYYNTLLAIATQCPYKGGRAVYQARVLLNLMNDTIEYNDADACLQEGIYRQQIVKDNSEINPEIKVTPNPANHKIAVHLNGITEGICVTKIYNSLGSLVKENKLDCQKQKLEIDIADLPAGLYSVNVNANGKMVTVRIVKQSGFPLILLLLLFAPLTILGQGLNRTWLLGTDTGLGMGRLEFDTNSYTLILQQRKMTFKGTQATISDESGNFLMSSNGVWIANALNDTMMNGSGLNPSWDVNAHPNGLLIKYGNIFLPFPGDSNKYVLFHHAEFDPDPFSYFGGIHKSVIDISQDGGLGAVIQKNDTLIQDQLTWGMAACKHANGRDWWVIAQKDSSDIVYKILLTPNGIENITTQNLGYSFFYKGNAAQITFSQDGTKFIQCNYFYVGNNHNDYFIISDFDRCTGNFSNTQTIQIATNSFLFGLAFSPSGKYAYTCTSNSIYQIDTDNLTWQVVANYDGFCFPNPPWCTTFFNMYLAANGKIYITSGNGVQHLHEMNYPDSAGTACDVQQHSIYLNGIWYLRSVPNHPNYYLGPVTGSVCDSLGLGITSTEQGIRNFQVSPNPNNGSFQMMYLLPQNKSGVFEMYDINGRKVYTQHLPPWSNYQLLKLPSLAEGIYQCVITSDGKRAVKKVVVIKQ